MLNACLHDVQRGLATLFGNSPALQVDADVAAEGHRDANTFLARYGLDPNPVTPRDQLQVQHVRAIQATLTRQQELARLGKCIDAFRAAVHAGAESDEVGTRALLDQCQLLRENARTTGKYDAAVPAP
jgi:hypothetical protein